MQTTPMQVSNDRGVLPDIEELHRLACAGGEDTYVDPQTGDGVFTALYLKRLGKCCGCGCRHCPYRRKYGRENVVGCKVLCGDLDDIGDEQVDLVFYSGGKDSFLAWKRVERQGRSVILVTTYEMHTGEVGHQGVNIAQVEKEVRRLGGIMMAVPVGGSGSGYVDAVIDMVEKLRNHGIEIGRLVFGDLHLKDIRAWRERMLGGIGELAFPVWGAAYSDLMEELEAERVRVTVSKVKGVAGVTIGEVFDREFVARLPAGVDQFGEKGEFHTLVERYEGERKPAKEADLILERAEMDAMLAHRFWKLMV